MTRPSWIRQNGRLLALIVLPVIVGFGAIRVGAARATAPACEPLDRLFSSGSLFEENASPKTPDELRGLFAVAMSATVDLMSHDGETGALAASAAAEMEDVETVFVDHDYQLGAVLTDPRLEVLHGEEGDLERAIDGLHLRWETECDG